MILNSLNQVRSIVIKSIAGTEKAIVSNSHYENFGLIRRQLLRIIAIVILEKPMSSLTI